MLRKIEKDNCFIIQHIENKAQFYFRRAGHDLDFAIFLPDTRNYVYRTISVDFGRRIFSVPWPYLGSVTMCWPPPRKIPDIAPADTPFKVDESRPSKEEVKRVIRHLKNGKAAGPDGTPPEAIKADLETWDEMLYNLFGEIWEKNEIPDDWKEGYSHWGPSSTNAPCARGTRAFKFPRICGSAGILVVHIFVSLV